MHHSFSCTRPIFKSFKTSLLIAFNLIFISASAWSATLSDGMYAHMDTSKGEIVLRLFYQQVPVTVSNFIGLAEGTKEWKDPVNGKAQKTRFYDDLSFHRVIKDFMVQGGDPLGTGTGGPGFTFQDEFHPDLKHSKPGILSMANAGPNTNGSQFFITHIPTPWLDNKHSVFGEVVEGMNVVNAIKKGDLIKALTIVRKGTDAKAFDSTKAAKIVALKDKELVQKNKKSIPTSTAKLDPAKKPSTDQKEAEEVSAKMLVIAYKGVKSPNQHIFYEQTGAEKIAQKLTDLARRKGVIFSELIDQFTDLPQQTELPILSANQPNFPDFLKPALKLKVGQISDPVDSPFGYLIFERVELELVSASHILISFKGSMRSTQKRSRNDAEKLAASILKKIRNGKDFAELAIQHSDGPSGPKGGELGRFPRGQMVPQFDKTVFNMKPGQISNLVETQFGFHIIKRIQ